MSNSKKWLIIVGAVILAGTLLLAAGREAWSRWVLHKAEVELAPKLAEEKRRAEEAEGRALQLEGAIAAKNEAMAELAGRLQLSNAALRTARARTEEASKKYAETRIQPVSNLRVDIAGLCSDLGSLGYPCQ